DAKPQPPIPESPAKPEEHSDDPPGKGQMMERRLAEHIPMALYTIDIKTGKINTFHHSTDWLNHVQFSPTDPTLIMFCHEGPWHRTMGVYVHAARRRLAGRESGGSHETQLPFGT